MNSKQQFTIRVVVGVIFIVIGCVFLFDAKLQAKSYTRELEEAFAAKLRLDQQDNGFDTSMLMAAKMHKSNEAKVGKDIITDMKKLRKPMLDLLASSQWTPTKEFSERLEAVEKALKAFSEINKIALEKKDQDSAQEEDKKEEEEKKEKEKEEETEKGYDDKDSPETDQEITPDTDTKEEKKDEKDEMGMIIPPKETPKDEEAPKLPEPKKEEEPETQVSVPGEEAGTTTAPGEMLAVPEVKPVEPTEPQPAELEAKPEEKVDETLDATTDQMNQEEESAGMQIPVEEPKPATSAPEPVAATPAA